MAMTSRFVMSSIFKTSRSMMACPNRLRGRALKKGPVRKGKDPLVTTIFQGQNVNFRGSKIIIGNQNDNYMKYNPIPSNTCSLIIGNSHLWTILIVCFRVCLVQLLGMS